MIEPVTMHNLASQASRIAATLSQGQHVFVNYEANSDGYLILLALGPVDGELSMAEFRRHIAVTVSTNRSELQEEFLARLVPWAKGDCANLAEFASAVLIALRK